MKFLALSLVLALTAATAFGYGSYVAKVPNGDAFIAKLAVGEPPGPTPTPTATESPTTTATPTATGTPLGTTPTATTTLPTHRVFLPLLVR